MMHLCKDEYVLACFKNKDAAQAVTTSLPNATPAPAACDLSRFSKISYALKQGQLFYTHLLKINHYQPQLFYIIHSAMSDKPQDAY